MDELLGGGQSALGFGCAGHSGFLPLALISGVLVEVTAAGRRLGSAATTALPMSIATISGVGALFVLGPVTITTTFVVGVVVVVSITITLTVAITITVVVPRSASWHVLRRRIIEYG